MARLVASPGAGGKRTIGKRTLPRRKDKPSEVLATSIAAGITGRDATVYLDASAYVYVKLLGLKGVDSGSELVEYVRKGLPYRAFNHFVANTTLTASDVATLVDIPSRTLARRKHEGRFQPEESDRLLRASRVFNRAIELFEGDRSEATHWLSRPAKALAGARPMDLTRTEVGALEVERLIDKLEHGIVV